MSQQPPSPGSGPENSHQPPYTAFPPTQQWITIILVALTTLASPLSATIYLPLLPALVTHFSVSIQAINLTITIYIVCQAIAPLLFSTHSDTFGRRPVYLISFALYSAASLGLALNKKSYAGLAVLRAIQSLGASAVLSVGYGVVADLRSPSDRGKVLGIVMALGNLGTAIGPVVGGVIAYTNGSVWWAFWAMLLFAASMFVALVLLLPETARKVVGNGSIRDEAWNRPLLSYLGLGFGKTATAKCSNDDNIRPSHKLAFKSPLQAVFIVRHPDVAIILWTVGSFYALWYTIQASIPIVFEAAPYFYNELQIGLCYLPGAGGVIFCMYMTGRVMDHNYRVEKSRGSTDRARSHEAGEKGGSIQVQAEESHDITYFSIERARSRFCLGLSFVSLALTVGYGWSTNARLHPAALLIFQFCIGFSCTWFTNTFGTLLVDIFPEAPSTAATAGNLARCGFSAAAVAVLDPLTHATNRGWFYTIFGILSSVLAFLLIAVLRRYGMQWRQKRQLGRETTAS